MAVIEHELDFAAGPHHADQLGNGLFRVRGVVEDTPGIAEVKGVAGEWEVFSIRNLQAFGLGQAVALDAVGEVGQSFFGQVNPGSNGPRPEPLDKVGAGAKANFEDPLAVIARELRKSM